MKLWLSEEKYQRVLRFADELEVAYATSGKVDNYWPEGAPSSRDANIRGNVSEAGFCQWAGLDYDPVVLLGGDGGVDCVLGGHSIQVKTTSYATGHLMFDSLSAFRADVAVLMWYDASELRRQAVVGWVDRAGFVAEAEHRTLNADRGAKFVLAPERLRDPAMLLRRGSGCTCRLCPANRGNRCRCGRFWKSDDHHWHCGEHDPNPKGDPTRPKRLNWRD